MVACIIVSEMHGHTNIKFKKFMFSYSFFLEAETFVFNIRVTDIFTSKSFRICGLQDFASGI